MSIGVPHNNCIGVPNHYSSIEELRLNNLEPLASPNCLKTLTNSVSMRGYVAARVCSGIGQGPHEGDRLNFFRFPGSFSGIGSWAKQR